MSQDPSTWPVWATEPVIITAYNKEWPRIAENLINGELKTVPLLSELRFGHIGSTAVPNLASKPILDIMASTGSFDETDMLAATLRELDWNLIPPELDKITRRCFVKVVNNRRFAHFHLVLNSSDEMERAVAFRDILRAQPFLAGEYARLKIDLAETYKDDREAYTEGKAGFITKVLRGGKS